MLKFQTISLLIPIVLSSCGSKSNSTGTSSCDITLALSQEADSSAASEQYGNVKYTADLSTACISFVMNNTGSATYNIHASAAQNVGYIETVSFLTARMFNPKTVTEIVTDSTAAATNTFSDGTIDYSFTSKDLNNKGSGVSPDTRWTLPWADVDSRTTVTTVVLFKMPKPLSSALYPTLVTILINASN